MSAGHSLAAGIGPPAPIARIGPNAVTRIAEALRAFGGAALADLVFTRAGLRGYLGDPPQAMLDEREVTRLHHALRAELDPAAADAVARDAGLRTARYLLAHRIPMPVQRLLRALPAPLAARGLLRAITRHAWTFIGSGRLEATPPGWRRAPWGDPVRLVLHDNPMCRGLVTQAPACAYHAAVFEQLFVALVHPQARAIEVSCEAAGADACRFEIRW